jgi:hypothetical protein
VPLATTLVESLQTITCLFLLMDSAILRSLLRGSYLQVVGVLGARQDIDRFLAV